MQILFMRLQDLDNRTRQLMEVHSSNMRDINVALGMQDAHLWVLRRLCTDIVAGTVKYTEAYINQREAGVNGVIEDPVDLTWYYEQFDAWLQQQQALAQQAEEQAQEEQSQEAQPQGVEEFGGDYGESENGSEENGTGTDSPENLGERGAEEDAVPALPHASGPE